MRSFDLKPTKENLIENLKEDSLGRNRLIYRFIQLLLSIQDATTISIDGKWGSGKTFFVKQLKLILEAYNSNFKIPNNDDESDDINEKDIEQIKTIMSCIDKDFFDETLVNNPQVVVYYDAWENDDEIDPVLSLIFRIVESINENFDIKIDFKIFDNIPGFKNLVSTIKDLKSIVKFNILLKEQEQNINLKQQIKYFLNFILNERGNKLIILIDELDRCSPSYAVKILERIKHYFDDDRIIFVFSTHLSQLTHTIKKFYGEGYNSYEYLNRFFNIKCTLPKIDIENYCKNIEFFDSEHIINDISKKIIKKYDLSLRQINKFYTLLKISSFNIKNKEYRFKNEKGQFFYIAFINTLIITLNIIDGEKYNNLINGMDSSIFIDWLLYIYNDKFKYFFNDLLFENKSNPENVNDKFKDIYTAVFIEEYTTKNQIIIGDMIFDSEIKSLIQNTTNLLSDFSYFGD